MDYKYVDDDNDDNDNSDEYGAVRRDENASTVQIHMVE